MIKGFINLTLFYVPQARFLEKQKMKNWREKLSKIRQVHETINHDKSSMKMCRRFARHAEIVMIKGFINLVVLNI
jgi:uncharacterized protein YdeI (YjbR/CyaY-like superfamily)